MIAAAAEAATHEGPSPDLWRDLVTGSLRMPIGLLKQIKDLLHDPTGIPDAGSAAADTVRGVMQQLGDTEGAHSPLWTHRSLQRRMEVLRAPFGDTRAAAKRLGRVLWNDPASGVWRHADAGYEDAIACAREKGLRLPSILGN